MLAMKAKINIMLTIHLSILITVISSMTDLAIPMSEVEQVLVKDVGLTAMIGVHGAFNFFVHFWPQYKEGLLGGFHCSMPAVCLLEEFVFLLERH